MKAYAIIVYDNDTQWVTDGVNIASFTGTRFLQFDLARLTNGTCLLNFGPTRVTHTICEFTSLDDLTANYPELFI